MKVGKASKGGMDGVGGLNVCRFMNSSPEEMLIWPTVGAEFPIIISAVIFSAGAGSRLESSQHPIHTLCVHTCVCTHFMPRLNQSNSHLMMFETQRIVCSCAHSYMSVLSPDGCFRFVWSLFTLFTKLKP